MILRYYPNGMRYLLYHSNDTLERQHGLNQYDFGARWYDPARPGTTTMDPLCERRPWESPYLWCAGNPVKNIDPTGKEKLEFFNSDDKLNNWVNQYPDDGAIHVFAHGLENGKGMALFEDKDKNKDKDKDEDKDKDKPIIIKSVSEFKQKVLSKSNIWKNKKRNNDVTIILHSCKTGKGDNSFAEKISEELKGVTVIAPTENISVNIVNKTSEVKTLVKDSSGTVNGERTGNWKVLINGEVQKYFNSTWEAKEKPSLMDRIFH